MLWVLFGCVWFGMEWRNTTYLWVAPTDQNLEMMWMRWSIKSWCKSSFWWWMMACMASWIENCSVVFVLLDAFPRRMYDTDDFLADVRSCSWLEARPSTRALGDKFPLPTTPRSAASSFFTFYPTFNILSMLSHWQAPISIVSQVVKTIQASLPSRFIGSRSIKST